MVDVGPRRPSRSELLARAESLRRWAAELQQELRAGLAPTEATPPGEAAAGAARPDGPPERRAE